MSRPDLRRLFSACDLNRSGLIEVEDFCGVCRELGVSTWQVTPLFQKLDVDNDGSINFNDFTSGFEEVSEILDLSSFGSEGSPLAHRLAWDEFDERFGDGVQYLRSREKLVHFHQQIRAVSDHDLCLQYEELISGLIKDARIQAMETDNLELALKRTEAMAEVRLSEMEEDLQLQTMKLEQKIRDEEQEKLEAKATEMQKHHETEISDLQAVIDRMKKLNEELWNSNSKGDASALKQQLDELTQENEHLRSSLLKSQTDISILEASLDKVKNELSDHRQDQRRAKEVIKKLTEENEVSINQIQMLQEANKALYDSNNGLRCTLEKSNRGSKKNSIIDPDVKEVLNGLDEINYKSASNDDVNSMILNNDESRHRISAVENWANRYLDSGVSTGQDVAEYSSDDFDSDHSNDSRETMHYSYSYVASDAEMPDVRMELDGLARNRKPSRPVSRCSSTASSRRRLPAFSPKTEGTTKNNFRGDGPLYRLVLAGDAGSGKSSFLLRLCKNEFKPHISTTLGVDFQMKKLLVDGESATLQIWDTAGQERFRSIAKSYFRKAHGVLLLYDVTSEISFLNVREWIDEIKNSTAGPIPIILIGNKIDLRNEMPHGAVLTAHGEKLAMTYGALFCETSAKDGTNVVEAVLHLAREAKKNASTRKSEPVLKLLPADGKNMMNNCCKM
ncbi:ras and EF-hand domain-containing protein [Narcine bancroftii]|uniref:ras and EF-hand domain-containing protein n=1 Tax=Narcine bancroftii TaxID=1343680 RepID=UPI003830FCA1